MKRLLIRILGKNDARAILRLSVRHRLYCVYFCISFCMLCIGDENPLWVIALVIANFGNAVRLVREVPLNLEEA
jgi:predicted metal-binding membrane protein